MVEGVPMAVGRHHLLWGSTSVLHEPWLVLGGALDCSCLLHPPHPSSLKPGPLPLWFAPLNLSGMIKNQTSLFHCSPGGSALGRDGFTPPATARGINLSPGSVPPSASPQAGATEGLNGERRKGLRVRLIISNCSVPLIRDAGLGNWDTESCQTLETLPAHTKCQCRQLATFAVLAQLPRDLVGDRDRDRDVPAGDTGHGWGASPRLPRWGSRGRMRMPAGS